jgi:xanthine dehydrogenase accessory factor
MRDILADVERWQKGGASVAIATVVRTWGSSPRRAGARMALTSDGRIVGSVSGGCVENAVVEAGMEILKTNRPQLLHFGVTDETAWNVGLACGGSIDVFVKPLDGNLFDALRLVIENGLRAVTVTVIRGPDKILGHEMLLHEDQRITGILGGGLDDSALKLANDVLSSGVSQNIALRDDIELFLDAILPLPSLVLVGGVHIAIPLISFAKLLGYRTILIEHRSTWGNDERFPHVDQLLPAWPEAAFQQITITSSTAVVMLTHDPKLDDPALKIALNSPAFYVGALGSKSTHAKRRERLLRDGLGESQLSRIHAPIGLDIGAQSPEEIALAIMAEVVESYRKRNLASVGRETALRQPLNH